VKESKISNVAAAGSPVLELKDITKSFGGVKALQGASLTLKAGEIHALMGENGAGKSTLLKTLAGVHRADSGEISLLGKTFVQGSTKLAREQGIAVIYQEPSLFPDLSLAENVFVGRQPVKGQRIDWSFMEDEASRLFGELGVALSPSTRARGLSIADQQIVEIAKALSINAKVIVMDEPTAALSSKEVDRLFNVARNLRNQGCAVVFVSHRLDEVYALCDQITVMRDGATVGSGSVHELDEPALIKMMVGREISDLFPKIDVTPGEIVLSVKNLGREGQFKGVTFEVRAGEIIALSGLVGAGRSEVVRAIFGIDKFDEGSVTLNGVTIEAGNSAKAMKSGMALVPEDRRLQGLFMSASIAKNSSITILNRLTRGGLLRKASEVATAAQWGKTLQLKYADIHDSVDRLSGGNQQKVVLAKWLATEPKLLIVDEPTRGIDVGTKSEVHRLLSQEAAKGMAIIMVSSELPEVLGMADRVLVMREGLLVGEYNRGQANPENVISTATGSIKTL